MNQANKQTRALAPLPGLLLCLVLLPLLCGRAQAAGSDVLTLGTDRLSGTGYYYNYDSEYKTGELALYDGYNGNAIYARNSQIHKLIIRIGGTVQINGAIHEQSYYYGIYADCPVEIVGLGTGKNGLYIRQDDSGSYDQAYGISAKGLTINNIDDLTVSFTNNSTNGPLFYGLMSGSDGITIENTNTRISIDPGSGSSSLRSSYGMFSYGEVTITGKSKDEKTTHEFHCRGTKTYGIYTNINTSGGTSGGCNDITLKWGKYTFDGRAGSGHSFYLAAICADGETAPSNIELDGSEVSITDCYGSAILNKSAVNRSVSGTDIRIWNNSTLTTTASTLGQSDYGLVSTHNGIDISVSTVRLCAAQKYAVFLSGDNAHLDINGGSQVELGEVCVTKGSTGYPIPYGIIDINFTQSEDYATFRTSAWVHTRSCTYLDSDIQPDVIDGEGDTLKKRYYSSDELTYRYSIGMQPVISTATLPNAVVGSSYSCQLTSEGSPRERWTLVSEAGGPPSANFKLSRNGTLTGYVSAGMAGRTYTFTVRLENAFGNSVEKTLTLTVDAIMCDGSIIVGGNSYQANQTCDHRSDEGWYWEPSSATLSLYSNYNGKPIKLTSETYPLNIQMDRDVTINAEPDQGHAAAISCPAGVSILGGSASIPTLTLHVTGKDQRDNLHGIYSFNGTVIWNDVKPVINITASEAGYKSLYGIYGKNIVQPDNSLGNFAITLTGKGAPETNSSCAGLYARESISLEGRTGKGSGGRVNEDANVITLNGALPSTARAVYADQSMKINDEHGLLVYLGGAGANGLTSLGGSSFTFLYANRGGVDILSYVGLSSAKVNGETISGSCIIAEKDIRIIGGYLDGTVSNDVPIPMKGNAVFSTGGDVIIEDAPVFLKTENKTCIYAYGGVSITGKSEVRCDSGNEETVILSRGSNAANRIDLSGGLVRLESTTGTQKFHVVGSNSQLTLGQNSVVQDVDLYETFYPGDSVTYTLKGDSPENTSFVVKYGERLPGTITLTGDAAYGGTLTAEVSGLPEGVTADMLRWVWFCIDDSGKLVSPTGYVSGNIYSKLVSLSEPAAIGKKLVVRAALPSGVNGTCYGGYLEAETAAVTKGSRSAPDRARFYMDNDHPTTTAAKIDTDDIYSDEWACEFRLPGVAKYADWQDLANGYVVLDGLEPGRVYTVEYRYKENDGHFASEIGTFRIATKPAAPQMSSSGKNELTVEVHAGEDESVTYYLSGTQGLYDTSHRGTKSEDEKTVTFTELTSGTTYYIFAQLNLTDGESISYQLKSDFTTMSTLTESGEDPPAGVTVSGTVKSYNPNNAVTIRLLQSGAEKYSTTIAASSGSGQVEQKFSIGSVAPGTYDLVVTKSGHLTYTVKNVVVGTENLDLAAMTGKAYQTITLLAGDVNGDGSITEDDVSVIRYSTNINKATASAENKLADMNGDGSVTEDDVSIVRYSTHINKGIANCTYQFEEG